MGLKKYDNSGKKIVISIGEEWRDEEEELKEGLLESNQNNEEETDDEEFIVADENSIDPEYLAVGLVSIASRRPQKFLLRFLQKEKGNTYSLSTSLLFPPALPDSPFPFLFLIPIESMWNLDSSTITMRRFITIL
jgi:hypothetical protein